MTWWLQPVRLLASCRSLASYSWSAAKRRWPTVLVGFAALLVAAPAGTDELNASGTVRVEQVQIAFIGSGNLGGGELDFEGKTYAFTIGGLGVGGIGVSKIEATGEVYNLTNLEDFPGAYVQARYGLAAGDISAGRLWLENTSGVVIGLDAERTGLALSLGGDAVYIDFD